MTMASDVPTPDKEPGDAPSSDVSLGQNVSATLVQQSHHENPKMKADTVVQTMVDKMSTEEKMSEIRKTMGSLVLGSEFRTTKRQKPTLDILPYDAITHIYKHASPVSGVCFSLTCKRLYTFYKIGHPGLISLDVEICNDPCCDEGWSMCPSWPFTSFSSICYCETCVQNHDYDRSTRNRLADLLVDWAGPQYRLRRRLSMTELTVFDMSTLLNKDVYGNEPHSQAAERLILRWRDFHCTSTVLPLGFVFKGQTELMPVPLPSPYSMGEDWYAAAYGTISDNLDLFDRSDFKHWRRFWMYSATHAFSEGAKMFNEMQENYEKQAVEDAFSDFFGFVEQQVDS